MKFKYLLYFLFFIFWIQPANALIKGKWLTTIYGEEEIGSLNHPQFLYLDPRRKRLYIVDTLNNRLIAYHTKYRKFISQFSAEGRLNFPSCMLKDKQGYLLVTNTGENKVLIINIKQKIINTLNLKNISPQPIPGRMKLDENGYLYLIDRGNKRILIFSPKNYKFFKEIQEPKTTGFFDLIVDKKYIYALDLLEKKIFIYDKKTGNFIYKVSLQGLDFPISLDMDSSGNFYVLDAHKGQIFVFNKKGKIIGKIARRGWEQGELYYPRYILLYQKQLYVVDTGNNRIQVFEIR